MKKMKEFFDTPKKAVISSVCLIAGLLLIGAGGAFAASSIARSSSIGARNAQNFAFADAGVDPAEAKNIFTEFDYEQGQFVYEVEFTAGGVEYDYWIKADDGTIVKKESEIFSLAGTKQDTNNAPSGETADGTGQSRAATENETSREGTGGTVQGGSASQEAAGNYIGVDQAKEIAVEYIGASVSDVNFTKAKLDEDVRENEFEYEIEFYLDGVEYEFTIDAVSGSILEYDSERDAHDWDD